MTGLTCPFTVPCGNALASTEKEEKVMAKAEIICMMEGILKMSLQVNCENRVAANEIERAG